MKWNVVPPSIASGGRGRWVSTKVGVWNGGFGPHQPVQSGSSCQPGGPNLWEPMISDPMPWLWRWAKASSTPAVPPSCQKRVASIHSCSRSPAWPNGASADCGSPVAKPSREMDMLWTLTAIARSFVGACRPPGRTPR